MTNIYFLQFLSSLFNLGEIMYNIGKNEVGTNCVMKIGGLRAFSQRECFLLMAKGDFFQGFLLTFSLFLLLLKLFSYASSSTLHPRQRVSE